MLGFIQPAFVDRLLQADDPAGFVDRQLFDFPPERDAYLDDLKVPIPDDSPNLEDILKVKYIATRKKIFGVLMSYSAFISF